MAATTQMMQALCRTGCTSARHGLSPSLAVRHDRRRERRCLGAGTATCWHGSRTRYSVGSKCGVSRERIQVARRAGSGPSEHEFAQRAEVVTLEPLADAGPMECVAARQELQRCAGLEFIEADAALLLGALAPTLKDGLWQRCKASSELRRTTRSAGSKSGARAAYAQPSTLRDSCCSGRAGPTGRQGCASVRTLQRAVWDTHGHGNARERELDALLLALLMHLPRAHEGAHHPRQPRKARHHHQAARHQHLHAPACRPPAAHSTARNSSAAAEATQRLHNLALQHVGAISAP